MRTVRKRGERRERSEWALEKENDSPEEKKTKIQKPLKVVLDFPFISSVNWTEVYFKNAFGEQVLFYGVLFKKKKPKNPKPQQCRTPLSAWFHILLDSLSQTLPLSPSWTKRPLIILRNPLVPKNTSLKIPGK